MRRFAESRFLKSKAEVMQALGGVPGLCELTGESYKATENWKRSKTLPSRYYVLMTWALRRKRLRADPAIWGQVVVPEMEELAA